jgi:hypothetical protein
MREIKSRLIPEDGVNIYAYHPGFDADECINRITINAATRVTSSGFACSITGGHCIPNSNSKCFAPDKPEFDIVMVKLPDGRFVPDTRFGGMYGG